mmetsp:Transcript_2830/g.6087  ORF Transcript_2830/g.6087 Transcript_2830/m.6087 type:complete len:157 (-) Transcript_2830:87-557(-)
MCESFRSLVGPHTQGGPSEEAAELAFNKSIQSKALESGALETLMKVVQGGQEMHHKEHGGFNFDIDLEYNPNRDCFFALASLGYDNPMSRETMMKAGMLDTVLDALKKRPRDPREYLAGCLLVKELDYVDHKAVLAAGGDWCNTVVPGAVAPAISE